MDCLFFFSSRRRHTRWPRDWSSDVCSSDLHLLILWGFFMIVMMGIGGFFMFRKFLKQIPKADGKSEMDWQNYYIEETLHMWGNEEKELLEELVSPVPSLFREVAKQTIESKIGELDLQKNKTKISRDFIIEGYIIGTPKRDHRFLRNKLEELIIDVEQYEHLFELSKDDYSKDWQKKYQNK